MKVLIYNKQDYAIIGSVEQALASCFAGETLVVFFVEGKQDMVFLESVEMGFMDIKLIVYFTDKTTDLVARAYKLSPRVVTGAFDSDAFLPAAVRGILLNLIGTRVIIDC